MQRTRSSKLCPGFVPYNPVGEKDPRAVLLDAPGLGMVPHYDGPAEAQMQEMLKFGFPKTLGPFALVRARKLALFVDRAAWQHVYRELRGRLPSAGHSRQAPRAAFCRCFPGMEAEHS